MKLKFSLFSLFGSGAVCPFQLCLALLKVGAVASDGNSVLSARQGLSV